MRPFARRLIVPLLLAVSVPAQAQKHCTKGIPCGNSCISAKKTCRVGAASPSGTATGAARTGATISGDLYVVTLSGDVKRGAANTVYLLPDSGWQSGIDGACQRRAAEDSADLRLDGLDDARLKAMPEATLADLQAKEQVSAANLDSTTARIARTMARLESRIDSTIGASATSTSPTGMEAHYVVRVPAAGRIVLSARMSLADRVYRWFVPAKVGVGDSLRLDLDNSNMWHGTFCENGSSLPRGR